MHHSTRKVVAVLTVCALATIATYSQAQLFKKKPKYSNYFLGTSMIADGKIQARMVVHLEGSEGRVDDSHTLTLVNVTDDTIELDLVTLRTDTLGEVWLSPKKISIPGKQRTSAVPLRGKTEADKLETTYLFRYAYTGWHAAVHGTAVRLRVNELDKLNVTFGNE